MPKLVFQSTKTWQHSTGLSCCFRQYKAKHSHCSFLHGYALEVNVIFEAKELDSCNWVVDFGGLKEVKQFLMDAYDHKTLVAEDDPKLAEFKVMASEGLIDLRIVQQTGCEAFAEEIFAYINDEFLPRDPWNSNAILRQVEVREHAGNSALLVLKDD